jgi:leucyl-tRNA synthetase
MSYFANDVCGTVITVQWAGSSWYYLRFADPTNDLACVGSAAEKDWLPVDLYVGGQEHAVLHLLYARFWHKVLFKLGVVSSPEPFQKVVHQGMILGADGEKMSKSRGNVVNPDDIVATFGADALRLYEMFMGPLEAVKPWQTSQVQGVVRFREKVFQLVKQTAATATATATAGGQPDDPDQKVEPPPPCTELVEITRVMHKTIKKVTSDIDSMSFNTAISALMIYTNALSAYKGSRPLPLPLVENLVLLLSPIAPHCAEEFWEMLGHDKSLMYHPWPSFEETQCVESMTTVVIQVNGKKRGSLELDADLDLARESVIEMALEQDKIKKFIEGKSIVKTIYVPGKIVNIVIKPS